jgi:hypothetical protein
MKTFINGLRYLNLLFAGTGGAIALWQIPKFLPELMPYWIFLWVVGFLLSGIFWVRASYNSEDASLPAITTISLFLLLVDVARLQWF